METLSKTQRLEQEVQYQNNHLQQAFDKVEEYFDVILEPEHRDLIKVIVMKTLLLGESQQELNHHRLELAQEQMENEKFWEKMSEG
jgi:hypothetical protein